MSIQPIKNNNLKGEVHFYNHKNHLHPKIHKEPHTWTVPDRIPPGRPTVSYCNSCTCKIRRLFPGAPLQPISQLFKDTYDFLDKIKPLKILTHRY